MLLLDSLLVMYAGQNTYEQTDKLSYREGFAPNSFLTHTPFILDLNK